MEHLTKEKEEVSEVEELCLPEWEEVFEKNKIAKEKLSALEAFIFEFEPVVDDENWRFMLGKAMLEQRKKS